MRDISSLPTDQLPSWAISHHSNCCNYGQLPALFPLYTLSIVPLYPLFFTFLSFCIMQRFVLLHLGSNSSLFGAATGGTSFAPHLAALRREAGAGPEISPSLSLSSRSWAGVRHAACSVLSSKNSQFEPRLD